MIKVLLGDIFDSKMQTLVNTVNCIGVMGKGIAKEFKSRYPDMFTDYKDRCDRKALKPGVPYIYEDGDMFASRLIVNFPTKGHWRSPSKMADILNGLDIFTKNYKQWGITSIAFPPLGCGNGGLEWSVVGKIMYQRLSKLDLDIEIYAPYGTSGYQLKPEFLSSDTELKKEDLVGKSVEKIRPGWIPIIECVYQMQKNIYSPKVGRIKFQKIAYIMTLLGVETGLDFRQAQYGPYSEGIKTMLHVFSNSNIISEEKLGAMTALIVNEDYSELRKENMDVLDYYQSKIAMTADLFERIKTTEKAEEVTSIIFKLRELKEKQEIVSDMDVLNALIKWKKRWDNDKSRESLIESIRNLAMLRWIKVEFSPELDYVEIY